MFKNPFKSNTVSVKAPWSNRSKILLGTFVAGCAGSALSVYRDLKAAADDTVVVESCVDAMLDPCEGCPGAELATTEA